MAITLTDKAAKHVQRNLDKRGKGFGQVAQAWLISWSMSMNLRQKIRYLSPMALNYL